MNGATPSFSPPSGTGLPSRRAPALHGHHNDLVRGPLQFNAITKRVTYVAAHDVDQLTIGHDGVTGVLETIEELVIVLDHKADVRLGRAVVITLDTEVDAKRADAEPTTSSGSEGLGFGLRSQAQEISVEGVSVIFPARSHWELHVVKAHSEIVAERRTRVFLVTYENHGFPH